MKITMKNKIYEIGISEVGLGRVKIIVNGKEFVFGEEKKEKISVAQTSFWKRDFSKKEIRTSIAGTVSEIFVKEGEFLRKEQKILTLSAMKMENEIVSDLEGKVKEILVKKNQQVKEGETLIILT